MLTLWLTVLLGRISAQSGGFEGEASGGFEGGDQGAEGRLQNVEINWAGQGGGGGEGGENGGGGEQGEGGEEPDGTNIYLYLCVVLIFLADTFTCAILALVLPLFWISGDVSSGFQSQCEFCLIRI